MFLHRKSNFPVRKFDIQFWALECARYFNLTNFKASDSFIKRVVKEGNFSWRKINKFQKGPASAMLSEKLEKGREFVEMIKKIQTENEIPDCLVFNTDQSGIEYQVCYKKTYNVKGEQNVHGNVANVDNMKKTFTIQPLVSMNGRVCPKLLVILKETKEEFGPRVKKELEGLNLPNLIVTCSKSGKSSKAKNQLFYENVFGEVVPDDSKVLLIQDAWSGQKDLKVLKAAIGDKALNVIVETLPAGTTSVFQPLDVFFFGPLKATLKRLLHTINIGFVQKEWRSRTGMLH